MEFKKLENDVMKIYKKHEYLPRKNSVKHNAIQEDVRNLAEEYGYKGKMEYRCSGYKSGRVGYIDVVWYKNDKPLIAFEVDSSVRPKSIYKLLTFEGEKFWIYYGNKNTKAKQMINDVDKENRVMIIIV